MDEEARLWGTFVTLATVGVLLTMGRKLVRYTRGSSTVLVLRGGGGGHPACGQYRPVLPTFPGCGTSRERWGGLIRQVVDLKKLDIKVQVSCRSEQTCRTSCSSTGRMLRHDGAPIWRGLTVKTGENCPNYRDFCSDRKIWNHLSLKCNGKKSRETVNKKKSGQLKSRSS